MTIGGYLFSSLPVTLSDSTNDVVLISFILIMEATVLGKHQIEKALHDEQRMISSGRLKEENPLDTSLDFRRFCEACRRGDLRVCQEQIGEGININARDEFDYTPLILVRLNGSWTWCRADLLKPP